MRLAALSLLALAACGQPAEPPAAAPMEAEESSALPVPSSGPNSAPRYVGLWAASQEMCADPAWRFEPRRISTKGEVSCDLNTVSDIPGGYAIDAACTAEGALSLHPQMRITFAESAGAMMIEDGPWPDPPGLVYCAALPEATP
ncbi:hypothetical protein U91I_04068 [alpha proteobacterium U9-1i]|nr:hypothetical protein U91I_04068 [alpha proteobacterium U9-1i]